MNIRRINRRLKKRFGPAVTAALSEGSIVLSGRLPTWEKVIEACSLAAEKYSTTHVVNDNGRLFMMSITCCGRLWSLLLLARINSNTSGFF